VLCGFEGSERWLRWGRGKEKNEWGNKIPVGIFYRNEHIPTYHERLVARIPNYMENPPSKQHISDTNNKPTANINKLLDDLRVDK
jgi:2-oxoglutarate ferredoxin oxidoreductase subunit beta